MYSSTQVVHESAQKIYQIIHVYYYIYITDFKLILFFIKQINKSI